MRVVSGFLVKAEKGCNSAASGTWPSGCACARPGIAAGRACAWHVPPSACGMAERRASLTALDALHLPSASLFNVRGSATRVGATEPASGAHGHGLAVSDGGWGGSSATESCPVGAGSGAGGMRRPPPNGMCVSFTAKRTSLRTWDRSCGGKGRHCEGHAVLLEGEQRATGAGQGSVRSGGGGEGTQKVVSTNGPDRDFPMVNALDLTTSLRGDFVFSPDGHFGLGGGGVLGSVNAETTPARAPAAVADRK